MNGPRHSVRVTSESIEIGTKQNDFGTFSSHERVDAPATIKDRYHVIDIERQESDWFVFFEQKLIGTISFDPLDDCQCNSFRMVVMENGNDTPMTFVADVTASMLTKSDVAAKVAAE